MNYYNENDPYAALWLQNLIAAQLIPDGFVDTRSIIDVQPKDLEGFTQCHFFAGIGGWSLALQLAGWPEDRPVWTGSAPCQPFSVAGKQKGQTDERHLWPELFRLFKSAAVERNTVLFGEQVAAAIGKDWLDGVCSDLETVGYKTESFVIPACAVDAPHRRDRLWFVADTNPTAVRGRRPREDVGSQSTRESEGAQRERVRADARNAGDVRSDDETSSVEHAERPRLEGQQRNGIGRDESRRLAAQPHRPTAATGRGSDVAVTRSPGHDATNADAPKPSSDRADDGLPFGSGRSVWSGADTVIGHDGKARRVKPGLRLLAHGVPARVGKLRAFGNAIVPQVAAEFVGAYLDCEPI